MYLLLSLVHPPPPSYDAGLLYGRGCPAYETVWNQHGCGGCLAFATATAYGMRSCKVALLVLWAFCGRVEAERWIQAGRTEMPSPHMIMGCGEKLFGHGCDSGITGYMLAQILERGVRYCPSVACLLPSCDMRL